MLRLRDTFRLFVVLAFMMAGGLHHSALAQATADFRQDFPPVYTETPMGVNLQTGTFRYFPFSLAIGPFNVQRGFNQSGFSQTGYLYWTSRRTAAGGVMDIVTVKLGETELKFYSNYLAWTSAAVSWKLERTATGYRLTSRDGTIYTFLPHPSQPASGYPNPNAVIDSIRYPDGHMITIRYSATGRLRYMRSSQGYALIYDYNGDNSVVRACGYNLAQTYVTEASTCAGAALVVTLNYVPSSITPINAEWIYPDWIHNAIAPWLAITPSMRLASVVDVRGGVSTLNYTSAGYLACMTLPNASTCEFTNVYGPQPGELAGLTKKIRCESRRQPTARSILIIMSSRFQAMMPRPVMRVVANIERIVGEWTWFFGAGQLRKRPVAHFVCTRRRPERVRI